MPIHDWTRVDAGLFHHFHQDWTIELCRTLNAGLLPPGYTALTDQVTGRPIPDVVTLNRGQPPRPPVSGSTVLDTPPKARFIERTDADRYANQANRVAIRHRHGEVVAVVEILSPGNKNSRHGLRSLIAKTGDLLWQGVNLLVIDLFPPSVRDPQGIHPIIWEEIGETTFELPPDQPLTVASYQAEPTKTAYVESVAVGDALPEMPLFLDGGSYIRAPLELTYCASWAVFPADFKDLVTQPENNP